MGKSKKIIVIALVVIALVITAAASYFIQQNQSPESSDASVNIQFDFVGVNMHSLTGFDEEHLRSTFQYLSSQCGVTVVRTFGNSGRGGVIYLRKVIDIAKEYNIKLIIVIADFSNGSYPEIQIQGDPTSWFDEGYKEFYLPYLKELATAFKDESTIFAFELANEPHCKGYTSCIQPYVKWADESAKAIKAIDPARKVSIGQMASTGPNGLDYFVESNSSSAIDFANAHFYDEDIGTTPKSGALEALELSKTELNFKPFYVGESGYTQTEDRPNKVKADMIEFATKGAVGYLYWQYSGDRNDIATAQYSDTFSFFQDDPVCAVLKENSGVIIHGDPPPTSIPVGTPASCNETCNMSVYPQRTCVSGLICFNDTGTDVVGWDGKCRLESNPDSLTCQQDLHGDPPAPAACNQTCNMSVNPQRTCQSGLFCYNDTDVVGADGRCRLESNPTSAMCANVVPGGCNAVCNYTTNPEQTCAAGLYCNITNPGLPGAGGYCRLESNPNSTTCEVPNIEPGACNAACNYTTNPPTTCESGLICYVNNPDNLAGIGGYCRLEANPSSTTCQNANDPVCTSFTYSDWGECTNGHQIRTVMAKTPSNCIGGNPLTQRECSIIIDPVICTSFTYSAWGACINGTSTRTVSTKIPTGCEGGSPVLTASCSVDPIICTDFTYSDWSSCVNGHQNRTVMTKIPAGCEQGLPVLTQTCNVEPDPPVVIKCTSFTYSNWGTCKNGYQTRFILTQTPVNCTEGTPDLVRVCEPEPPEPPIILTPTTCGPIDVNTDGKLTIIDFAAFALIYGRSCTDAAFTNGCRGKDTNSDSKVDIIDFASFAQRYGKASCI